MTGVDRIRNERQRVVEVKGITTEHDAEHGPERLLQAAVAYILGSEPWAIATGRRRALPGTLSWWPFEPASLHLTPADRIAELAKAGQFIAAAIDLLAAEIREDEGS